MTDVDDDLESRTHEELLAEAKRLRAAIRVHRDSSGHELCWHHPQLWALLPERTDPKIMVPDWPQFMRGCIRYRQSLDEQLGSAPRTGVELDGAGVEGRDGTEKTPLRRPTGGGNIPRMRTYISLLTFTQQGVERVQQHGGRIDDMKKAYRAAGGELIAYYPTMGHYDGVAIYRMPDDAAAAQLILATMARGNVRSETLRAFEEDEYRKILDALPASEK